MADSTNVRTMCLDELADWRAFLGDLDDTAWTASSLCEGFEVRDVVAHVFAGFHWRFGEVLALGLRYRLNLDRLVLIECPKIAESMSREELVEAFVAESQEHPNRGVARFEPPKIRLADNMTHRYDIALPLGIDLDIPDKRLRATLDVLTSLPLWGSRSRIRGLRLNATDIDWKRGSGREVSGPAGAIILALGGRAAGLEMLEGDGVEELRERI